MPLLALNQARRRGPGALRSHLPAHGGTRMHVDPGRCGLDNLFVADDLVFPNIAGYSIPTRPCSPRAASRRLCVRGGHCQKTKREEAGMMANGL